MAQNLFVFRNQVPANLRDQRPATSRQFHPANTAVIGTGDATYQIFTYEVVDKPGNCADLEAQVFSQLAHAHRTAPVQRLKRVALRNGNPETTPLFPIPELIAPD
jgi:hypothetical protein